MRILFLFFLFCNSTFAQDFQADPMSMAGQAGLVTFRYEIGDTTAKLFVVGTEAIRFNFEKDVQLIEVTAVKDDTTKEQLRFQPDTGYYVVKNPPRWDRPYQVKVKAKINGEEKTINLQIRP